MHYLNAPLSFQLAAVCSNVPQIKPIVELFATTYKVVGIGQNGAVEYDSSQVEPQVFDLSPYLLNTPLTITKTAPPLPNLSGTGELLQYGDLSVQVSVCPLTKFLAYASRGGGLTSLKTARIKVGGVLGNERVALFEGVIVAINEAPKSITFQVRPSMWDLVKKPLFAPYSLTRAWIDAQGNMQSAQNQHLASPLRPFLRLSFSHPSLHFDANGAEAFSVRASNPEIVDLLEVQLSPQFPAKLGLVKVDFENSTLWKVETPTLNFTLNFSTPLQGNGIYAIAFSQAQIEESGIEKIIFKYSLPNAGEIKGKNMEIWLCYNAKGNPISIALDLISRALRPDLLLISTPLPMYSDKVDYAKFLELEELFSDIEFHVTEGNRDNIGWQDYTQKPYQVKNLVGKVLAQIGCQLIYNEKGQISINSNWYNAGSSPLHSLGSTHTAAPDIDSEMHTVFTEKEYSSMGVKYAYDWFRDKYTPYSLSFQDTNSEEKERFEAFFPHIKTAQALVIQSLSSLMWGIVRLQHIRLDISLHRAMGLVMQVGDSFYSDFSLFPIPKNPDKGWGYVFNIYDISVPINDSIKIKCICLPKPANVSRVCEANVCEATTC